jgi:hypothetical protein
MNTPKENTLILNLIGQNLFLGHGMTHDRTQHPISFMELENFVPEEANQNPSSLITHIADISGWCCKFEGPGFTEQSSCIGLILTGHT